MAANERSATADKKQLDEHDAFQYDLWAVQPPDSNMVVPPLNFAMVEPGVYRSGYPNPKNFGFLKQLKLKAVMYILWLHASEQFPI